MLNKRMAIGTSFFRKLYLLTLLIQSHAIPVMAFSSEVNHTNSSHLSQQELDALAQHLKITYRVVSNESGKNCLKKSPCYFIELKLSLPYQFTKNTWQLYFSQLNPILSVSNDDFIIHSLEGDVKTLKPTPSFMGFTANQEYIVNIELHGDHLNEFKPLGNYYLTGNKLTPALITSTVPIIDSETGLEKLPHLISFDDEKKQFISNPNDQTVWTTTTQLFDINKDLTLTALNASSISTAIIPTPSKVVLTDPQPIHLSIGINVQLEGLHRTGIEAALMHLSELGIEEKPNGVRVNIKKGDIHTTISGAYRIETHDNNIDITARDETGAFYALQSLASLLRLDEKTIPSVYVEDLPRFPFRGMHLDVARNFHSLHSVKQLIRQMSAYKLNKLHLHLADDEAWRLEIKGLPELTEISAFRCHDLTEQKCLLPQLGSGPFKDSSVNGYFSISDYMDLLIFANNHHIEIIPSFDLPGHARAAIKAMEVRYNRFISTEQEDKAVEYLLTDLNDKTHYNSIQNYTDNTINVCLPSANHFIEKIIDEVAAMHMAAGVPLKKYHIGADESPGAWHDSPACAPFYTKKFGQQHEINLGGNFIADVANMLADKGIEPAGWNDGMEDTNFTDMPVRVQSNVWALLQNNATEIAHKHANQGWDVVLSLPEVLYFDMPYEASPKERGYDWAARELNSRKIFEFMPENLPIHAEYWSNLSKSDFQINDNQPLKKGKKFIGIQGHLWSEVIRSPEQAQYMIFPRLLVLAEKAWTKADWEVPYNYEGGVYNSSSHAFSHQKKSQRDKAWNNFANVLGQKEFLKLDLQNIDYRIPTVGATIVNGQLEANIAFPGLTIEYRFKDKKWLKYNGITTVNSHEVEVRAISANGLRHGRATLVN